MNPFRRHPLFCSSLLGLGAIALAAGWLGQRYWRAQHVAYLQLQQRRQELAELVSMNRTNGPAALEQNEKELASAKRILVQWQSKISGGTTGRNVGGQTSTVPENGPESYFDLARFTERMRTRARETGVALNGDERFGFSEYGSSGPERDLIDGVFRQRILIEQLLEHVFAAHPQALLSVQREQVLAPAESLVDRSSPRRGPRANADLFERDPRFKLAIADHVRTQAFRVSFTGDTGVLREILNGFVDTVLACAVRTVEVEPLAGSPSKTSAQRVGATDLPLVQSPVMRCTITVEVLELIKPVVPAE